MNSTQLHDAIMSHGTNASSNRSDSGLIPAPSSSSFSDIVRLVLGTNNPQPSQYQQQQQQQPQQTQQQQAEKKKEVLITMGPNPQQAATKRQCRAPISRRFAHPCSCSQSNNHHKSHQSSGSNNGTNIAHSNNNSLPAAAYSAPIHLFDPWTKKCLPTSRSRDMLLKECRPNVASPYPLPHQLYHGAPCVYDDLVCDARRNRCVCKPLLHLYYESINGTQPSAAFGCVPLGSLVSPDGRTVCKTGQFYNVITRDCQRIFDINELPPSYTTGVSATQFSFVTIVLIWILLLILIVTAKVRKLRTAPVYRDSPAERRLHRAATHRHHSQGGASAWLHPFIAAVNGHHHINQHRANVDRNSGAVDDAGNFNDTDFFLTNGNRRLNELFSDGNLAGSQHSLNNPPPKFEEIYPSCPEDHHSHHHHHNHHPRQPHHQQQTVDIQPPSNEDLPTYDEAMKLQNTIPLNQKE